MKKNGFGPGFGPKRLRIHLRRLVLLVFAVALGFVFNPIVGAEERPREVEAQDPEEDWFRPEADSEALKRMLDEEQISDRWIYHDLDAARDEARRSGKPIVVVFRCVPCGSAPGLDGALCTAGGAAASDFEAEIRAAGGDLNTLLEQFVAVRMVKMNGVNRHVFQFDRDVPYVAMFLNADGVVYGRYGTRASNERKNLPHLNLSSFQQSLRRALELHRHYPENKQQFPAQNRADTAPPMAEDMETFEPFPEKYNPTGVKNCIHCHTVGEAEKRQTIAGGTLTLRDLWPFPRPENIGLKIDDDDGLKIKSVGSDSPAADAGVQSGDVLLRIMDRPLTSAADIQWALHEAPDEGMLPVVLRRGERTLESKIALLPHWRKNATYWRASLQPLRPNLILRPDHYRVKKGAKPGEMGLAIYYPRGPAAAAGLRNGDLLVAVDGKTDLLMEADFLHYIHVVRAEAKSVECTVIRKGTHLTVTLPIR